MNDNSDLISEVLKYIRAGWKQIAVTTLLGLIGGTAYAFLAPKWYSAELSVVPSVPSKGGSLGSLSGAAASFGMADLPIDFGGSDVDRVSAIFHSNSVTDSVIAKFNLKARYRERYLEDTREELWKHCAIKIEKKPSVVTLSCEDKSPQIALAIAANFAENANQVARRVAVSSASEERRFLETRVAQSHIDLDKASRNLREFQEKNRVISLPEQAKAIVTSMATIRAEMLEKQMQLAYVDDFSSSDESTSGQLRRQVSLLQAKLKSLEEAQPSITRPALDPRRSGKQTTADSRNTGGLFPPAMNVPKIQYEIEQLYREQKIQETLLLLLTQRYETARVNEARDTSTIQVLDQPVLPTKRSRPRRLPCLLWGSLAGMALGAALVLGRPWRSKKIVLGIESKS